MGNKQETVLKLDASYKVKHEKYENFEASFFRNVYKQAAKNVKEIIESTKTDYAYEEQREYTEPISSLITFDGKRGSGKTSAMLSFCDFLRDFNCFDKRKKEIEKVGVCRDLLELNREISFTVLDCIDATLVTDSKELMGAILGKMLMSIEDREQSNSEILQPQSVDVRRLKTRLGEIYCSLKAQDIIRDDTSPGEVLEQLSRSWNQQRAFRESVQKFNKYMSQRGDGKRQNYLVIPIDDVDMNLQNCYELLETVRKYMMVPNVIVLLAADDEQLETICVKAYRNGIGKEVDIMLPQKLALEYLEKLIPSGRRIYMPNLYREENLYEKQVWIMQEDGSRQTVKDTILLNVWRYVGIILNKDDENSHWLQPHSLRKLSNYVNSMRFLSETKEGEAEQENFYKNINWFYEDIIKRHFNELKRKNGGAVWSREFTKALEEFENAVLANKLQRLTDGLKAAGFTSETKLSDGIRSYGDLLALLYRRKEDRNISEICQAAAFVLSLQMRRLIFAIEDREVNNQEYEEVIIFSKGDFWGESDKIWLEASGKSKVDYQFECEIPIAQLFSDKKLNILDLLLLTLQLDIEESAEGKYKGYCRFGNFVNGVFDYKNKIDKMAELIKKEMQPPNGRAVELENARTKLLNEFDNWQENYKTTRVIPFDSAEFIFVVFDKLYGDQGVFRTFETEEQYVQMYMDALKVISEILDSYDKYYSGIRNKYKTDGRNSTMNELKTGYKTIYDECPFIKHMSGDSSETIISSYISLFRNPNVAEKKNMQSNDGSVSNDQSVEGN